MPQKQYKTGIESLTQSANSSHFLNCPFSQKNCKHMFLYIAAKTWPKINRNNASSLKFIFLHEVDTSEKVVVLYVRVGPEVG